MNYALGLAIVVAAAQLQAAYPLPMKYARKWNWEVSWFVFCVLGLIILPWLAVSIKIPNLADIYTRCSGRELAVPLLFGALWGVAVTLYGRGISLLGVSLGNSIMSALGPTVGSLIPLIVLHPQKVFQHEGISILVGIVIMLVGICFCGLAGQGRDMEKVGLGIVSGTRRYGAGLFYIVASGILAPSFTLALAFGAPIMKRGTEAGVAATDATYLIWALVFPAGSIVCIAYCLRSIYKNRLWSQVKISGTKLYWVLIFLMALMSLVSTLLYGVSTVYLGPLGVPIAQALFVIFSILGANVIGFLVGEWRGVRGIRIRQLAAGVTLLVVACVVIAVGNR